MFFTLAKCDLDLLATDLVLSLDTLFSIEGHFCRVILKYIHETLSWVPYKHKSTSILFLISKSDLDLSVKDLVLSRDILSLLDEHFCQVVLKFIYANVSYSLG